MSDELPMYELFMDELGDLHRLPYGKIEEHWPDFWCPCNPVVDISSKSRGGEFIIYHVDRALRRVK